MIKVDPAHITKHYPALVEKCFSTSLVPGTRKKDLKCKFCPNFVLKSVSSNTKAVLHICGVTGQDVAICKYVPADVKNWLRGLPDLADEDDLGAGPPGKLTLMHCMDRSIICMRFLGPKSMKIL